jgi:glycosyltransferase involved in cell wall biosynthesis
VTTDRKKVAILTNLISPYRVPLFGGMSANFVVTVAIGLQETNRPEWTRIDDALNCSGVQVREIRGLLIRRSEDSFLHVNPGYLLFLFRERPNAVISFELGFRTLCAVIFTAILKRPLWIWSEGTSVSDGDVGHFRQLIRSFFVRVRARWVTLGTGSTDYLVSLGVRKDRILQIQNGVDDKRYTSEGDRAETDGPRPLILAVGQLIERKGLDLLLQSAKRLQDSGEVFTLRLVGSGPRRAALEAMARDLQLDHVEFLGGIPSKDVPAQYRAADSMVFPTLKDVWGLVVNEAMLCGTPVICSKYAGCAVDLLESDDIFDPLSPEDFDRALLRAVKGELTKPNVARIWSMDQIVRTLCSDIESTLCGQSE